MRLRLPTLLVFGVGACARLLGSVESTPAGFSDAATHAYRTGPDAMLLHVVKPAGWSANDRRGALLFFFGGGWTRGTPEASIGWARWAASHGLVGIAPDYRTKDRRGTPPHAAVADARAALRWIQERAEALGIDPARIAVGGNSAGGHLALWTGLGAHPPGADLAEAPLRPPAALVLFSAVSDTSRASGYTPQRFGSDAEALSPIHQLGEALPAVLAFHGDADQTVPYAQAVALDSALRARGIDARLVTVPGGRHDIADPDANWRERSQGVVAEFLRARGIIR